MSFIHPGNEYINEEKVKNDKEEELPNKDYESSKNLFPIINDSKYDFLKNHITSQFKDIKLESNSVIKGDGVYEFSFESNNQNPICVTLYGEEKKRNINIISVNMDMLKKRIAYLENKKKEEEEKMKEAKKGQKII